MDDLLTTDQAAALCKLSPRTFESLRVKGGGPIFIRLGRAIRYRLEDVEAWIRDHSRRNTSEESPPKPPEPGEQPRIPDDLELSPQE
jgi:predicted DNA-binding transcriptional regulator AlpA